MMTLGSRAYLIEYLQDVINNDSPALLKSMKLMIKTAIEECLMVDPIGFGKPLRYSLKGHRRLRVSDYRVVYRINPLSHAVIIIAIKHRKEIYQDF